MPRRAAYAANHGRDAQCHLLKGDRKSAPRRALGGGGPNRGRRSRLCCFTTPSNRRPRMAASITGALARIKGELDRVLPGASVDDLARAAGHRWRDRLLTPSVTVHLCLLQLLARVALAGLAQVAGVAASAQAFCKARQRLPVALFHALVERAGAAGGDD